MSTPTCLGSGLYALKDPGSLWYVGTDADLGSQAFHQDALGSEVHSAMIHSILCGLTPTQHEPVIVTPFLSK